MNDKVSRIALVLIGLVISAFVVKAFVADDDPTGSSDGASAVDGAGVDGSGGSGSPGSSGAPGDGTTSPGGGTFDPLQGGARVENEPEDAEAARLAAAEAAARAAADLADLARRDVGPPLADGTPVDVSLTFVPGAVSRYRITNVIVQRDRKNSQSVGQRWIFEVTTKVSGVDADGSARIRLVVDAMRIQAIFPDGLRVDFDSRNPDEAALADRAKAVTVRPLVAVIGIPVEFRIAPNGGCVAIEGIDAWHEAWVDVVEELSPGSSRQTVPPYTAETVRLEWSEYLFPPILGGELKAGEERDVEILRDTLQSAYVQFFGPLSATHDDGDVFRVRLLTTPAVRTRQGAPRSPQEAAVARVHVQSDKDAYDAAWRFQRSPGRLIDAEIDTKYQLWVSWKMGEAPTGQAAYERVFLDVERLTRVELLPDDS